MGLVVLLCSAAKRSDSGRKTGERPARTDPVDNPLGTGGARLAAGLAGCTAVCLLSCRRRVGSLGPLAWLPARRADGVASPLSGPSPLLPAPSLFFLFVFSATRIARSLYHSPRCRGHPGLPALGCEARGGRRAAARTLIGDDLTRALRTAQPWAHLHAGQQPAARPALRLITFENPGMVREPPIVRYLASETRLDGALAGGRLELEPCCSVISNV